MNTTQRKFTDLQYRRMQGGQLVEQGYGNQEIVDIFGYVGRIGSGSITLEKKTHCRFLR